MSYHRHSTTNAGPLRLDVQVPDFERGVRTATDQACSVQVETTNLPRVAGQRHDGPRAVGFHVPDSNGLVVGTRDDAISVELHAADSPIVALKGTYVALSPQPAAAQAITSDEGFFQVAATDRRR